jgi:hypothetical protein
MVDAFFETFFKRQEEKQSLVPGFGYLSSQEEKDLFKETIFLARIMFDMPIDEVELIDKIITRLRIFRRLLERFNFLEAILVSKVIYDNIGGNPSITKTTVMTVFDQQKNAIQDILDHPDELRRLEHIVFSHYRQMILMINDMIAKELLLKDYTGSRTMLYAIGTGLLPFQVRSWETICMKLRDTFDSVLVSIKYLLLWKMYFIHEKMLDEESKVDLSLVLSKEQLIVLFFYINEFNDWCSAPTFVEITNGLRTATGMLNAHPSCRNPLSSKDQLPFHVTILKKALYMVFDKPVMAQDSHDDLSCLVIFCLTFMKSLMQIRFSHVPKTKIVSDLMIPPCVLNIFKACIRTNNLNVGGTCNRVYSYLNTHSDGVSYVSEKEILLRLV